MSRPWSGRSRGPQVERTDAGFTILSVLIAVILMAVGIVAVSGTAVYLMGLQTEASVRSTATGLAVSYMEQTKTRPVADLASEEPESIDETGAETPAGRFTRTLTVEPGPEPNSKLVTVTIGYPSGLGRVRSVQLVTIVYGGTG